MEGSPGISSESGDRTRRILVKLLALCKSTLDHSQMR
jgi:hypothetical protein